MKGLQFYKRFREIALKNLAILTARSIFIIFLLLLFYQRSVILLYCIVVVVFLSHNCPIGRFHIGLVQAFRSRWETNSQFDLRHLLFVMTLIIFSFTRFILQKNMIAQYIFIQFYKNEPASYLILELFSA